MASYYFWKWAENDLPGRPAEVQADLLRGEMHPALQPFDPRRLLTTLRTMATRHRDEEWQWEVMAGGPKRLAGFVFVTDAFQGVSKARQSRLWRAFAPLKLSGYDEGTGGIIYSLPPKLNCFKSGQSASPMYDVGLDDLPVLLRGLDPKKTDPFGILGNRHDHFVQCYAEGRRFIVEWACNQQLPKTIWDQWRAQDAKRLEALGSVYGGEKIATSKAPDLLRYADTLRIFQAFVRGEPRPTRTPWRNINLMLG